MGYFGKLVESLKHVNGNESLKKSSLSIVVFLVVVGIDKVVEKSLFKCPSTSFRLYGLMFLFGPATIMFAIGFLTSKYLISGLQGCWKANTPRSLLMQQLCKCILVALASFVIYLGISLMQKDYYICLKLGPKPTSKHEESKAAVESQLIAWGLFICLIGVVFFAMLIKICFLMEPQADPEFMSIQKYEKLEAQAAAKCFKRKLELLAEEQGEKTVSRIFAKIENNNTIYDAADIVTSSRNLMLEKYPRGRGDLSRPYRSKELSCSVEAEGIHSSLNENDTLLLPLSNGTANVVRMSSSPETPILS